MKTYCRILPLLLLALLPACGGGGGRARELLAQARASLDAKEGERRDRLARAQFLLGEALGQDPELVEARVLLGAVLIELSEPAKAMQEVERVPPGDPRAALVRARAAAELYRFRGESGLAGQASLSLQEAGAAATAEDRFAVGHALVSGPEGEKTGPELGIQVLQELVKAEPEAPGRWHAVLAVALLQAGRPEEAKAALARALEDSEVPERARLRALLEGL